MEEKFKGFKSTADDFYSNFKIFRNHIYAMLFVIHCSKIINYFIKSPEHNSIRPYKLYNYAESYIPDIIERITYILIWSKKNIEPNDPYKIYNLIKKIYETLTLLQGAYNISLQEHNNNQQYEPSRLKRNQSFYQEDTKNYAMAEHIGDKRLELYRKIQHLPLVRIKTHSDHNLNYSMRKVYLLKLLYQTQVVFFSSDKIRIIMPYFGICMNDALKNMMVPTSYNNFIRINESEKILILKLIFQAIDNIHAHGYYHHYMKPEDILVRSLGDSEYAVRVTNLHQCQKIDLDTPDLYNEMTGNPLYPKQDSPIIQFQLYDYISLLYFIALEPAYIECKEQIISIAREDEFIIDLMKCIDAYSQDNYLFNPSQLYACAEKLHNKHVAPYRNLIRQHMCDNHKEDTISIKPNKKEKEKEKIAQKNNQEKSSGDAKKSVDICHYSYMLCIVSVGVFSIYFGYKNPRFMSSIFTNIRHQFKQAYDKHFKLS